MLLQLQKCNCHVKNLWGSQMYITDISRAYMYLQADHSKLETTPDYSNLPTEPRTTVVLRDCWHQWGWLHALIKGYSQQIKQCTVSLGYNNDWLATDKEEVPVFNCRCWNHKEELTIQDGVLFKGMRVIVSTSMRPQMIARTCPFQPP